MRIYSEKNALEFCFEGSTIRIYIVNDEIHIAEVVTYEVSIGEYLSKIQIIIKNGKVYVSSPLGVDEVQNPENTLKGLNELIKDMKNSHPALYEKIQKILSKQ
ncbi:hypothetical protein [Acidianus manzaensis]|uniref:Uncharacterized protein n=1 Tax=Acidianus manzaensis TaxID=282676 RepID=A0A1W6JY62_9CREN|nr:hypothetical protein [Acidianus manzaensis]ARM75216.1 hypothetical protein B6F84_03670 [Acidianus manzaensis]